MSALSSPVHPVKGPSRRWLVLALTPALLAALGIEGYSSWHSARAKLAADSSAAQERLPQVQVETAVVADGARSLTLPGTLEANQEAAIDARATGYVLWWRADIGDRVAAGFALAQLDTPELNQQLAQARAALKQKKGALEQAVANSDYADVTATREDALLQADLSSKQTNDQAHAQVKVWEANVDAAKADVAAARANVRELEQMVSFGQVVAPFDGRITQRNIDVGTLVTAGGGTGTSAGQPMFRIEATDPIRVFVQVPQTFALSVKDGESASVSVRELPGHAFDGHVTRTTGTLDPASRTLKVQIDVPNPTGELLAGMFAQVTLAVALPHRVVVVPSSAVITDARGVHVATLDGEGQVHLVAVQRGIDNGREIDLLEGLTGGEQVVINPGADITDGMRAEAVTGT
jgi:membrane fusion protein (multidrug efflux system)